MRIVDITERAVAISRYADPAIPSGGLTTSIVALTTDALRDGRRVVGYGFASIGRFAQSGLIRERVAPLVCELRRIAAASPAMPPARLAADAMNSYDAAGALAAAAALAPLGLWWFDDVCDPLDFETQAAVAAAYGGRIASVEALFAA